MTRWFQDNLLRSGIRNASHLGSGKVAAAVLGLGGAGDAYLAGTALAGLRMPAPTLQSCLGRRSLSLSPHVSGAGA